MTNLYLDTETYSERTPKTAGTYHYAEECEVMIITYAVDDGPVLCWDYSDGQPVPDLAGWVEQHNATVIAHNAMFDRNVLRLGNLGIHIPIERWQCTMTQAYQHALPGSLEDLGDVLGLDTDQRKIKEGKKLIQRFCKPAPRGRKAARYTRETHPDEWQQFVAYAIQDVATMREIHRRLPRWNWQADDTTMWHLDQIINDRGFAVDQDLVEAGARAAAVEKAELADRFAELTGGLRPTQRDRVRDYINGRYGLRLTGTAKHLIQPLVASDDSPVELKETCRIILSANKTSTAKYAAMGEAMSTDGRFRGGLQFAGAQRTRRWAGRVFQPQNLPSRGLPKEAYVNAYIDALKAGVHRDMFDDPMLYGAAALRGIVTAPPGRKLVVSDLSNIEGRLVAWLAGEEWKLQAFRDYDAGMGPDLYKITAAAIIGGAPEDIDKKNRNVFGKVPDLAGAYQGGNGAFDTFEKAYCVNLLDYWPLIQRSADPAILQRAHDNWDSWGKDRDAETDRTLWIAREVCKLSWRARHPATVALWYAIGDATKAAMAAPGTVHRAGPRLLIGRMRYRGHDWLLVKLPSGKFLTYFHPQLTGDGALMYEGYTQTGTGGRVWGDVYTYGGKTLENACQALGGDIIKATAPAIEEAGYRIVLTVHDEDVTEVLDRPEYNANHLSKLLATPPTWADGLPLSAAGFEGYRYKKED